MSATRWIITGILLVLPIPLVFEAPEAWMQFPALRQSVTLSFAQELSEVASILCVAAALALYMSRKRGQRPSAAHFTCRQVTAPSRVLSTAESEPYRTLRAHLVNFGRSSPLTSVAVLSAERSEGRSTTAVNIAMAAALAGTEVLLVDADLRNPGLHQFFGIGGSTKGLSDLLLHQCDLSAAIQPTGVPQLNVITAGTTPAAAVELLASDRMKDAFERLKTRADLVVADTPASLGWSDALLVAPLTDAALYVVRPGHQDASAHGQVRSELQRAGVTLLGVVVNDAGGVMSPNGHQPAAGDGTATQVGGGKRDGIEFLAEQERLRHRREGFRGLLAHQEVGRGGRQLGDPGEG